MDSQLETGKSIGEYVVGSLILCGDVCNTLALLLACLILALVTWPFSKNDH